MTEINPANSVTGADATKYESTRDEKNSASTGDASDTSFIDRTQENDLTETEFSEEEGEASDKTETKDGDSSKDDNGQTTGNTTDSAIALVQLQQQMLLNELARLNRELQAAYKNRKQAQTRFEKLKTRDGADTSDVESKISGYDSEISSINSNKTNILSQFQTYTNQIMQLTNQTNTTTSTASVDGASGVSGTSSASGVSSTSQGTLANYNAEKGQALANAAEELYGSNPYSGGMCGAGVSASISRGLGLSISGNGCDYKDLLRNDSHFVEVTDQYPTVESLYDLPAGAIVSWAPYNTTSAGNTYGHVYIADGKGNEISDFKAAMYNEHYANGGSWTVFFPV